MRRNGGISCRIFLSSVSKHTKRSAKSESSFLITGDEPNNDTAHLRFSRRGNGPGGGQGGGSSHGGYPVHILRLQAFQRRKCLRCSRRYGSLMVRCSRNEFLASGCSLSLSSDFYSFVVEPKYYGSTEQPTNTHRQLVTESQGITHRKNGNTIEDSIFVYEQLRVEM